MRLLLPVDSRVRDTRGFVVIDTDTGQSSAVVDPIDSPFARQGLRGACVLDGCLYVCTSHSVRVYDVKGRTADVPNLSFAREIRRPEWLVGRGANADLHSITAAADGGLLITSSFHDAIDHITVQGELLERRFAWEVAEHIEDLVARRNERAADLCHLNHIEVVDGQVLVTMGNLNGSGLGAVIDWDTGAVVLDDLPRPHDGVFIPAGYALTATSRRELWIWRGARTIRDVVGGIPRRIPLDAGLPSDTRFWARGIAQDGASVLVGCSQLQDRETDRPDRYPTHIAVVDLDSGDVVDRITVPSFPGVERPVVYTLLDAADLQEHRASPTRWVGHRTDRWWFGLRRRSLRDGGGATAGR